MNMVIWTKGIARHFQGICWNLTHKHCLNTHKTYLTYSLKFPAVLFAIVCEYSVYLHSIFL